MLAFPLKSTFIAVPLTGEATSVFRSLQEQLLPWANMLGFQNSASPHLTLQYWPTVMEIEYGQILRQAAAIAAKARPFPLKLLGIGTFGARGSDRVLFLAVPFSDPLARLRKLCPWPSDRPFDPHVTLARIKHPQRFAVAKKKILKALGSPEFSMQVDRLRLYAEVAGAKQTLLEDFPFG